MIWLVLISFHFNVLINGGSIVTVSPSHLRPAFLPVISGALGGSSGYIRRALKAK